MTSFPFIGEVGDTATMIIYVILGLIGLGIALAFMKQKGGGTAKAQRSVSEIAVLSIIGLVLLGVVGKMLGPWLGLTIPKVGGAILLIIAVIAVAIMYSIAFGKIDTSDTNTLIVIGVTVLIVVLAVIFLPYVPSLKNFFKEYAVVTQSVLNGLG